MSSDGPVRAVLVAHGSMSEGLVDAVRKISGADESALTPVSNQGKAPDDLAREIAGILDRAPGIVFTDMQSGSCAMAARLTCRDQSQHVVVCGANLPMLLDFVFHRDMPVSELAARLVEKGKTAIQSIPSPRPDGHPTIPG